MNDFLTLLENAGVSDAVKTAEAISQETTVKQASALSQEVNSTCNFLDALALNMSKQAEEKKEEKKETAPAPQAAPQAVPQAAPQAAPQAPAESPEMEAEAKALFIQEIESKMSAGEQIDPEEMELYNSLKAGAQPEEYAPIVDKVAARREFNYRKQAALQQQFVKQAAYEQLLTQKIASVEEVIWEKLAHVVAEDILAKQADANNDWHENASPAEAQGVIQQEAIRQIDAKTVNVTPDMKKGDDGAVDEALKALGDLQRAEKKTAALKAECLNIIRNT